MITPTSGALHLTSEWFIHAGREAEATLAITQLVADVHDGEPDTLIYLVHQRWPYSAELQSLPPSAPNALLFFEVYRNAEAFARHVEGPIFTRFLAAHGDLFVAANGRPYTTVKFLQLESGFIRELPEKRNRGDLD